MPAWSAVFCNSIIKVSACSFVIKMVDFHEVCFAGLKYKYLDFESSSNTNGNTLQKNTDFVIHVVIPSISISLPFTLNLLSV